jgi:DNA-binding response OmpR family regulator
MKTILLIEDNAMVLENTAEMLEIANYHVVKAENGKIGVEKAQLYKPDLIICDILMPELNGYEVIHALNAVTANAPIPFIFLTALSDRKDVLKGLNAGAIAYLVKPFDSDDLLKKVEASFLSAARSAM